MFFNSIDFAIFLPIVFVLYWFVLNRNLGIQNLLIVAASYLFYGWWDWRFLSLILLSTVVDYFIGLQLHKEKKQRNRKALLWISLFVNLGLLGFFKYFNFFIDNFSTAFTCLGGSLSGHSLNIILPVGISFYTFQTLSYTIDIYRNKLTPTGDFVAFAAFVSFFPQLVAGPIERATNLLPQFYKDRSFDYHKAVNGLRQILWGLFKKVVIADNCAIFANLAFNNSDEYGGMALLLGALFFTFQIYGDFSGYSDIAIGTARLFGFNLKQNFAFPYFSRDIAEFWRRWHISLSTWFRDYLYIPLGGSRGGTGMRIRNTFAIFLVSGFWHGANWTFIVWGFLNALYFLPLMLLGSNRKNLGIVAEGKWLPTVKEIFAIAMTFALTVLAWIFFRADSVTHAITYISRLFDFTHFSASGFANTMRLQLTLLLLFLFLVAEWIGREEQFALARITSVRSNVVRYGCYYLLAFLVLLFSGSEQQFIYFQF